MRSELTRRVVTAIVAIPLLLVLLWLGGYYFIGLLAVLSFIFFKEANNLAQKSGGGFAHLLCWVMVCMVMVGMHMRIEITLFYIWGAFFIILSTALFKSSPYYALVHGVFYYLYGALGFGHAVLMRDADEGLLWLIYVLAATFMADTGAYFAGKAFGRHKLAPSISPGKSWEGVAGGVILSYITMIVAVFLFRGRWELVWTLIFAVLITFAGLAGDLAESAIKRRAGVKDSGTFFPGHGGVMDRVDSLMVNIPLAYYFFRLAGVM